MSTINSKNVQVGTSGTATNNFTLYQPASPDGTVRLGVGNSGATSADVVTATSAGNVGIGTSSPGQKLTVAGTIESTSGGVKFPDGTTQTTAASTPTTLYAVGTYVIGRPNSSGGSTFAVNSTVAGSSLYAVSAGAVTSSTGGGTSTPGEGYALTSGSTLVNTGSWRCVSPCGTGPYDGPAGAAGYAGLYVRFA